MGLHPRRRVARALAIVWAAVVFSAVAVSQRQRCRYYLPLSPPVALLLAAGFHQLRWRWRSAAFASVWITSAAGLMSAITARQGRMTDWQAIGQEVGKRPEPLFALGAAEIVFGFYLDRPVFGTPDYQTFARAPAPCYLLAPARAVARLSDEGQVREVAEGLVGGRHFVLLKRE